MNSGPYNFGPDNSRSNHFGSSSGDKPNIWLGLLGFFFPIIGFIVWLVMRPNQPLAARSAGVGTLIGFCLQAIATILVFAAIGAAVKNAPAWLNAQATQQAANGTFNPQFQITPQPTQFPPRSMPR